VTKSVLWFQLKQSVNQIFSSFTHHGSELGLVRPLNIPSFDIFVNCYWIRAFERNCACQQLKQNIACCPNISSKALVFSIDHLRSLVIYSSYKCEFPLARAFLFILKFVSCLILILFVQLLFQFASVSEINDL
jgi:hypothetical protein